ncbi:uncharacterized protein MONOS_3369 [Monocercomonoides exilis]|uniref:uncharacterized protein n=1 Tax=Monocercomonoides exilis TaxID=2049356 RepID=UPI00355A0DA0|nr:hypothetical protein MONOS_3369 [Monocercomonoides exilis]|eukprot:MONOS_3369.1-p1 / transcript=MONOS_3369.1 / gene=MONOS_3369 / organism=Monocercomonoides_exilis_PA203 / gene_product=unspecified product / transcript_product=unspecified product / location=Mono_scaffold00079:3026-3304(+) / protein_length=93 / sequence_SO=supercontig / SO=protein_coding / is_pseudo=false
MTLTLALVELCAERERFVGKPFVDEMIQTDWTMIITFIGVRLLGRRGKKREGGRNKCLVSDCALFHLKSEGQKETMDEFVAIGAVVRQERDN